MKTFSAIFLALISLTTVSQTTGDIRRTYHWYFGNGAGLDFSGGSPVAVTNSAMTAEEGCAAISDSCGNLLFYTDGDTVWNRNHLIMLNGTGLMGCPSSTQSALIIPQPGNDSIYFLFLTDCGENSGANGLRYSVVNVNGDGGLGAVIELNTLVFSPSMEKLAATYHGNGSDIWVVGLNRYPAGPPPDTTYQYHSMLLTASGVNTPITSPSLIVPHKAEDAYMRFSHNGALLVNSWHAPSCYWCDSLEVLSFDNLSGILFSPYLLVPDSGNSGYGVAFSPDDSRLYHSIWNEFIFPSATFRVYQYNMLAGSPASIELSKSLVYSIDTNWIDGEYLGAIQTGADGILYVAKISNIAPFYPNTIDAILNPNGLFPSCEYVKDYIDIGGTSQLGLPNFVDSYTSYSSFDICDARIENFDSSYKVEVFPLPASEKITIRIIQPFNEPINIELYNSAGTVVIRNFETQPIFDLYRGDLPEGIYLLRIQIGNQNINKKITFKY